jgi:hypothetical protein
MRFGIGLVNWRSKCALHSCIATVILDSKMSASPAVQKAFISSSRFAVLGASVDRAKYGNKVLRWYQTHNLPVVPVNPVRTQPLLTSCDLMDLTYRRRLKKSRG